MRISQVEFSYSGMRQYEMHIDDNHSHHQIHVCCYDYDGMVVRVPNFLI
jgi:hypothetical protein